uniref:Uncharacterized protein n=1 Tax=Felis catus TaxID=9685 RepID=A0ABI7Y0T7_FELCA
RRQRRRRRLAQLVGSLYKGEKRADRTAGAAAGGGSGGAGSGDRWWFPSLARGGERATPPGPHEGRGFFLKGDSRGFLAPGGLPPSSSFSSHRSPLLFQDPILFEIFTPSLAVAWATLRVFWFSFSFLVLFLSCFLGLAPLLFVLCVEMANSANTNTVPKLYRSVIEDVINDVRDIFLDDGVDEQVLMELKTLREDRFSSTSTKTTK